jgi:putative membrane protein insertion efficiency factor
MKTILVRRVGGWVSRALEVLIRAYQRFVSPAMPRRCKYEPTCSAYALQAVRIYGPGRGLVVGAWRLLRCNPFSHGGYDPPQAQRLFSSAASNQSLVRAQKRSSTGTVG